ncbi:MAG: hypothetical protein SF051_08035 [Elusimicrobiota bacterium]|nr:hypothetical protein [Elusimicrobiota bacterium]
MNAAPLALLLAGLAAAAEPLPATVSGLKESYVSAVDRVDKTRALQALARTAPRDTGDVSALYDLFMRFPDPMARRAALDSLSLSPQHPTLEPLALAALRSPEPESVFFGAHVAALARTPAALDALTAVASRRLAHARAEDSTMATERGAWWAQYEALDVLAAWRGAETLPLLRQRVGESPAVAAIMGRRLWAAAFPELRKWAGSSKAMERARAREAARQPSEPADARAVRAGMLEAVADAKLDAEFRHQVALKLGASSDDAEAVALAAAHDAAKTSAERLLWGAALFASGRPAAIPVLARYAREDPDELRRRGALAQLTDMVGAEKAKALVEEGKVVK